MLLEQKSKNDMKEATIKGWVARDCNPHRLFIHTHKPMRMSDMWGSYNGFIYQLDPTMFPDITWTSEPKEVEITIKIKE